MSYFALIDEQRGKLLLVDHKFAGLWLPSGGHVERRRRSGLMPTKKKLQGNIRLIPDLFRQQAGRIREALHRADVDLANLHLRPQHQLRAVAVNDGFIPRLSVC